jgi:hypothetical protein
MHFIRDKRDKRTECFLSIDKRKSLDILTVSLSSERNSLNLTRQEEKEQGEKGGEERGGEGEKNEEKEMKGKKKEEES